MEKTIIYLVRHGQSLGNIEKFFCGQYDIDIAESGLYQAKLVADFLRDKEIDIIYSSDLIRAYKTAEITSILLNLPIIKNNGLREIDGGKWQKVLVKDLPIKFKDSYSLWSSNIGRSKCDGGESVEEFRNRIFAEIKKIIDLNIGKTILIFTHGMAIRCFASLCLNYNLDQIKDLKVPTNCSTTTIIYSNNEFILKEYAKDDYLKDVVTETVI